MPARHSTRLVDGWWDDQASEDGVFKANQRERERRVLDMTSSVIAAHSM
jgi:hypothetical protein